MRVRGIKIDNPNPPLMRRDLVRGFPLVASSLATAVRARTQPAGRAISFIDTSLGRIAYHELGRGPVAIFLHGLLFNGYFWRNVTARVAGLRRTIAIDLMAHGETTISAAQDVSLAAQAKMLDAVCDKLDLGQVDLVGNDSGGGVAQIFAARHPARIRSLTLTDCIAHDNWPGEGAMRLRKAAEQNLLGDVIRKWLSDLTLARTAFARGYEHPEFAGESAFRQYLEPLVRTPERTANLGRFLGAMDNRHTREVEPELRRLSAPTLIAWGTDDVFFDLKWARWLRELIPGARKVVEIEGGRLFFPEERSDALADALREHWS